MQNKMTFNKEKVYLAHQDDEMLKDISEKLISLNLDLVGTSTTSSTIIDDVLKLEPDLIIAGIDFDDGNGIDELILLAKKEPFPALICAKKAELIDLEKAAADHVMGFLIDPVDIDDLYTTCFLVMKRFGDFAKLQEENQELKQALEARKKLDRAKGIVMKKYNLSEEEAYLRIRKAATSRRIKMSEITDLIIGEMKQK